jgi:CheY-like chemotaxis protein
MARLLVVDDSKLVQGVLQVMLQKNGHEVTLADNVMAAVYHLREQPFDLILMNLNMPGPSGQDGIRALRGQLQVDASIIVLSGEITPEIVDSLSQQNVSGFVEKAVNFEAELLAMITKELESGNA